MRLDIEGKVPGQSLCAHSSVGGHQDRSDQLRLLTSQEVDVDVDDGMKGDTEDYAFAC